MSYYGDDDYDYDRDYRRRRPSPHRYRSDQRRTNHFLSPNADGSGLYRTRSQGHAPAPNVYVYNDIIQDANQSQRSASRSPPTVLPYPPSPRSRGRSDELAEGVLALALDSRRSRSRGRSDAGPWDGRSDYYERQFRDMERQKSLDRERERIKQEYEIQKMRDDERRRSEDALAKEQRKRIIAEHEQKLREESEERKEEETRMREKIAREAREKKEKEEREYNEFLVKQKQKEQEQKDKKKKEEEEFQDEMRKRLARFGYTHDQIEAMVKEESDKKEASRTTTMTTTMTRFGQQSNPVYPKIHVKYLSVDTLRYYELPWEYDSYDSNYIIIKREMDKYETEVLFEHTRKLRAKGGQLLLEPQKDEKKYAFYRKRDRSSSRIRKLGILEMN